MEQTKVTAFRRHDMLFLNGHGLARARRDAGNQEAAARIRREIPGIVRRREGERDGYVGLGFSFPERGEQGRVRVASAAPFSGVDRCVTPWGAAELAPGASSLPQLAALEFLRGLCRESGVEVGVFGSAALQVVTGLPYLHRDSDLDVILRPVRPRPDLAGIHGLVGKAGERTGAAIDAEMEWRGMGVKLKELLSGQRTALCKGLWGVELHPVREILESL